MAQSESDDAAHGHDHAGLLRLFAVAAGLSVANLYYCQPLLKDMMSTLGAGEAAVGVVPTLTQVGYAAGMLLLVPLGDVVRRRSLVFWLLIAVALSMVGAALAPTVGVLAAASLAIGVTTVVPQVLLPYAVHLVPPARRGKAVGTVMTGLLLGILLSRTASGLIGSHLGWRAVYWIGAGAMGVLAVVLTPLLPAHDPPAELTYARLLRSVWGLVRTEPVLRQAMLHGALIFAAFSAFWATLVFRLAAPPLNYGTATAGLFGLVGAAGALAASVMGRLADRTPPRAMLTRATVGLIGAWAIFWAAGDTLAGLAVGVIVLDVAVQGAHVTNMTRVYGISAAAHSRVNSAYMVAYFLGGSAGTLAATQVWNVGGWGAVCGLSVGFAGVALAGHLMAGRAGGAPVQAPLAR